MPRGRPRLPAPGPLAGIELSDFLDAPPHPASVTEPTPAGLPSMIQVQRDAMRETFALSGVTHASLQLEMIAVARAAAAEGDYTAAGGIYKTIAQMMGAFSPELHLHQHAAPTDQTRTGPSALRAQPDDALRALILQARQRREIREADAATPIEAEHVVSTP